MWGVVNLGRLRDVLPATVATEDGRRRAGLTAAELSALVRRIGGSGDRFVIVERMPVVAEVYVQTWHEGGGPYVVEFRDGGADRHFRAEVTDPERVVAVLVDWAREGERWRTDLDWQPYELEVPELPTELREEVEVFARGLVHGGFRGRGEIVVQVTEHFADEERPVWPSLAQELVASLWAQRLAEQADWPELTEADRLLAVFDTLDADGIVARSDFACCRTCGMSEIVDEAGDGARGFVFFHEQDTVRAVAGGGMWLAFGTLPGSPDGAADVGREVAAALTTGGLPVEWDGSAHTRIHVTPLAWHKRLLPD